MTSPDVAGSPRCRDMLIPRSAKACADRGIGLVDRDGHCGQLRETVEQRRQMRSASVSISEQGCDRCTVIDHRVEELPVAERRGQDVVAHRGISRDPPIDVDDKALSGEPFVLEHAVVAMRFRARGGTYGRREARSAPGPPSAGWEAWERPWGHLLYVVPRRAASRFALHGGDHLNRQSRERRCVRTLVTGSAISSGRSHRRRAAAAALALAGDAEIAFEQRRIDLVPAIGGRGFKRRGAGGAAYLRIEAIGFPAPRRSCGSLPGGSAGR